MSQENLSVWHNANIIDATGRAPYLGHIVMRNETLLHVGPGAPEGVAASAANQRDLQGRYLLPGMMDCHVHLTMDAQPKLNPPDSEQARMLALLRASRNALRTLHAGVTTVRDCGTPGHIDFALRRAAQEGWCMTPRLMLSGQALCMTGGHGWQFLGIEVDGVDGARRAARAQLKAGADNVKLIATGGILTPGAAIGNTQLTEAEMRAAVEEAHNAGKIAAAHAHGGEGVKNAIRAGVDSVEHGYFIDEHGIELMLEHGTWLVPTSAAVRNVVLQGTAAGIPEEVVDKARSAIDAHVSGFKAARKAGVRMVVGTDAGVPFTQHGSNLDELVYLVEMGMTAMEAIQTATRDSARLLKLDARLGTLEAGKLADFIVVDGDPLADIAVLREPEHIRQVVLNGQVVVDRDLSHYVLGAAFSGIQHGKGGM